MAMPQTPASRYGMNSVGDGEDALVDQQCGDRYAVEGDQALRDGSDAVARDRPIGPDDERAEQEVELGRKGERDQVGWVVTHAQMNEYRQQAQLNGAAGEPNRAEAQRPGEELEA